MKRISAEEIKKLRAEWDNRPAERPEILHDERCYLRGLTPLGILNTVLG